MVRLGEDELVADDTCTYAKNTKACHIKYLTGMTS